jgi:hypothetical protein
MGLKIWVRLVLAHTRFVPTPLYRLLVVGQIFAGLSQLIFGAPASVTENSPHYFNNVFIAFSLLGGVVTLVALYFIDGSTKDAKKLHASLNLELLGLILIQTAITINVAGVFFTLGTPTSSGTWFLIMFWGWAWFRMGAIVKATRELSR